MNVSNAHTKDIGIATGQSGSNACRHVALIMDGNGRWAEEKGKTRSEGHRQGLEALRRTVRHAVDLGIEYLTVYSFSSENWSRPEGEVRFLMSLLRRFVQNDIQELNKANIRIRIIGRRDDLEKGILSLLEQAEGQTRDNTGMTLVIAFNYGARDEILRAVRGFAQSIADGTLTSVEQITEEAFSQSLDTAGIPDPDFIIRTSGEQRLSNFLMWQASYSEFYFPDIYWPDFDELAFDKALAVYKCRERRFGGLDAKAV